MLSKNNCIKLCLHKKVIKVYVKTSEIHFIKIIIFRSWSDSMKTVYAKISQANFTNISNAIYIVATTPKYFHLVQISIDFLLNRLYIYLIYLTKTKLLKKM